MIRNNTRIQITTIPADDSTRVSVSVRCSVRIGVVCASTFVFTFETMRRKSLVSRKAAKITPATLSVVPTISA